MRTVDRLLSDARVMPDAPRFRGWAPIRWGLGLFVGSSAAQLRTELPKYESMLIQYEHGLVDDGLYDACPLSRARRMIAVTTAIEHRVIIRQVLDMLATETETA